MPADSGFLDLQVELAAWVRDPSRPLPAGMETRRLAIYRELFFNNVREFVETAYPVLKSLLPAAEWAELLQAFFREHRAQSPYFRDISLEFRGWLESSRTEWLAARPWATELLHYEWAELAADCAETPPEPACLASGDLLTGIPVLRSAVWPLVYRWPVHALSPASPPAAEPPAELSSLVLWRDDGGRVRRVEATPLVARLVEVLLQAPPLPGQALLQGLARETGCPEEGVAAFVEAGATLLEELRAEGLILGIRCDTPVPA